MELQTEELEKYKGCYGGEREGGGRRKREESDTTRRGDQPNKTKSS